MSDSVDEDLRDVFKLLYDSDDWAMDDDEDLVDPSSERTVMGPEVEQVEDGLEDPTERLQERYSRKRFIDELAGLLAPTSKRQRIYTTATPSSSTSVSCDSPFPQLPSPTMYAPFSPLPLLARLRTFQPSSYSPYMPSPLNAVQAALFGWVNEGRDTLSCRVCKAMWDLSGVTDIRDEKVRMEVAKRLGPGLASRHKKGCSWKITRSPDILPGQLRRLLHPLVTSDLVPLASALDSQCIAGAKSNFRYSSALTDSESQNLAIRLGSQGDRHPENGGQQTDPDPRTPFATALALFCWYPFHPNSPPHTISNSSRRTDMVQCRICERRVGLWAFRTTGDSSFLDEKKASSTERIFDLVGEHLGWCPIRDEGAERRWWDDLPLLKVKEKAAAGAGKEWIRVSEKMEVRPWRRARTIDIPSL